MATALAGILLHITVVSVGLLLIVNASFEGSDVEFIYFVLPSVVQLSIILLLAIVIVWKNSRTEKAWWEGALGLSSNTSRQIESLGLKELPPRWLHVMLILEQSQKNAVCQVRDTLVIWDYKLTAADTLPEVPNSVLVLDPVPEEEGRKVTALQQASGLTGTINTADVITKAKGTPMSSMEVLLFSTLRLRNRLGTSHKLTEACYLLGEFLG